MSLSVDLTFSADQLALRDAVRALIARMAPIGVSRDHLERPDGAPISVWNQMTELGWHGLLIDEQRGGLGCGAIEAVIVAEELGAVVHGGPMFASGLLAPYALEMLGLDSLAASHCAHARRFAVAIEEAGHGDPLDRVRVTATGRGNSYRLNGRKIMAIDAHECASLLAVARARDGLRGFLVDPADCTITWTPNLDLTRKVATVEFNETPAEPVGATGNDRSVWQSINDFGALLCAAELVGCAQAANSLAIEYAQAREVFGKPLSKFQVTRHKAVDRLREVELARVGVFAAAWSLAHGAPDASISIAMAKAQAAEAANQAGAECIQVHGGMGYTWDCDAHLHLRRAKANDILFGDQTWQRARVADAYFSTL